MKPQVATSSVPVSVDRRGTARDVLVPGDVALATVLAELEVPAADAVMAMRVSDDGVVESVGAPVLDANQVLRAATGTMVAAGASLGPRGERTAESGGVGDPGSQTGAELAVIGGLASGATRHLVAGIHRLPNGALLSVAPKSVRPQPWISVASRIETLMAEGSSSDDAPSVLAFSPPVEVEPAREAAFRRPPRPSSQTQIRAMCAPDLPPPLGAPTPLSWASLLAPLPIALAMAFFFRPLFALFGLMGPVLVLGRWFEQRRSRRKQSAARAVALADASQVIRSERERQAEAMAQQRWERHPHVAHLKERARARSVRTWERRLDDDDRLTVTVGVGPALADPIWDTLPATELGTTARAPLNLRAVPHVVDLLGQGGLGVYGETDAARAVVRSIVMQLATLRGPADLSLIAFGDDLTAWEWVKWLPHLDSQLLAAATDEAAWRRLSGQGVVVIVDDPVVDVASLVRVAAAGEVEVTVLAVARSSGELPAACTTTIAVDAKGNLLTPDSSAIGGQVIAVGIDPATCAEWARSLTGIEDAERLPASLSGTLAAPTLLRALAIEAADGVLRLRGPSASSNGEAAAAGLPFLLGCDACGPVVLDLVADGPHALVAGTTGSGKSELLRTLVLSLAAHHDPKDLSFVLVDFKGGGAFDGCADLPHVAGLVTDLDEALVQRALTGLRAEVRSREQRLRQGDALTRLVVVIDEFAVLATEYPEVLDGLIDLAARGRGLQMHLVLATQKPSGVVDHRIRANTNLRIALRVQHGHESLDVVGVPDAAMLDRSAPGRAILRIGADEPRPMQVCVTSPSIDRLATSGAVAAFGLPSRRPATVQEHLPAGEPPLDELARHIVEAGGQQASPLWMPLLPPRCTYSSLRSAPADAGGEPGYVVGTVDRPEAREQAPFVWHPESGGLAIFSADTGPIQHLVGALIADVVSGRGPIQQVYVLGAAPQIDWAPYDCVGAVVPSGDRERVERLLAMVERRSDPSQERNEPPMLLAIPDIGAALAMFDDLERLDKTERLEAIARTGTVSGVHLVIGSRSVRDLPHRLAHHLPHRLLGRVADPTAHLLLGVTALPTTSPWQMVDVDSGHVVLIADHPEPGEIEMRNQSKAPEIGRCPERLVSAELAVSIAVPGGIDLAVGLQYCDLSPAVIPMRWGRHVLIAGPRGAGRTETLRLIGERSSHVDVRVCTVSPALGEFEVLDGDALLALAQAPAGDPVVLLVDDVDRLPEAIERTLRQLLAPTDRRIVVAAATTIEDARSPRSLAAVVRAHGVGLLVGGNQLDGEIFRIRRPEVPGLGRIPGRATLVVGAMAETVHLAISAGTA